MGPNVRVIESDRIVKVVKTSATACQLEQTFVIPDKSRELIVRHVGFPYVRKKETEEEGGTTGN
jgi:hypothetical protein